MEIYLWRNARIVNSRRVDNPGAPPQINRHTFSQDSYLYLPRTFVVDAPYLRRTLAVHASAKAAFFMLNIENTTSADPYTAYIRLRYDVSTAKVDIMGRVVTKAESTEEKIPHQTQTSINL